MCKGPGRAKTPKEAGLSRSPANTAAPSATTWRRSAERGAAESGTLKDSLDLGAASPSSGGASSEGAEPGGEGGEPSSTTVAHPPRTRIAQFAPVHGWLDIRVG